MQLFIVKVNGKKYPLAHNPIIYPTLHHAKRCAEYFSEVGNETEIISANFDDTQLDFLRGFKL